MEILKVATDWAKAELVSTSFFIIAGIVFVMVSFGFWQFGKTELARAYVIPILVTGAFLMTVGFGLFFTNKSRITQFEIAYNKDAKAFVASEFNRIERTINEYKTIVFKGIPIILIICSLGILFLKTPVWRASFITAIAMLVVILLVDGTARNRIENYNEKLLELVEKQG